MASNPTMDKFAAMLHYMISKCGGKPDVGGAVLCKLCYFSDFDHYELYERSLTGAQYVHLEQGPVPLSFQSVLDYLVVQRRIGVTQEIHEDGMRDRYRSLRLPDTDMFTKDELDVMDSVIERYSDMNAEEIGEISCRDIPLAITEMGEALDYEAVFYRDETMSVREYDSD